MMPLLIGLTVPRQIPFMGNTQLAFRHTVGFPYDIAYYCIIFDVYVNFHDSPYLDHL